MPSVSTGLLSWAGVAVSSSDINEMVCASAIIEEYKELNKKCDAVLTKIAERKSAQSSK